MKKKTPKKKIANTKTAKKKTVKAKPNNEWVVSKIQWDKSVLPERISIKVPTKLAKLNDINLILEYISEKVKKLTRLPNKGFFVQKKEN